MSSPTDRLDRLVKLGESGRLAKSVLADSLNLSVRRTFLDRCAAIEKRLTEECTGRLDPCLASGCAVEGDICLNAVLSASTEYHKACAAEWRTLFADPRNRADTWQLKGF